MHAVVLRAAGDRAFCAGLDTKKPYGQPDDVWNHEDPGELLSPKWQQVWKPVVCAVHGICTAGAFYFVNEADIVICSRRRHVLRLARHLRAGLRARAGRPHAQDRPGRDAAHGAVGQRRAGHRRDGAADRPRHRGRRPRRRCGHGRTRSRPASPASPRRRPRAPCARSGSRSTARTAPPCSRASSTPGSATRSASAEVAERGPDRPEPRSALMADDRLRAQRADRARCSRSTRRRRALEFEHAWHTWGELAASADAIARARRAGRAGRGAAAQPARAGRAAARAAARPARAWSPRTPTAAIERVRADLAALGVGTVAGETADLEALAPRACAGSRATTLGAVDVTGDAPVATPTAANRRPASRSRCSPAARPARRSGCRSPTRRSRGCSIGAKHYERNPDDDVRLRSRRDRSSTRRWCTSAACSGCCSASTTAARSACSNGSGSTTGSTPCAATGPAP